MVTISLQCVIGLSLYNMQVVKQIADKSSIR